MIANIALLVVVFIVASVAIAFEDAEKTRISKAISGKGSRY